MMRTAGLIAVVVAVLIAVVVSAVGGSVRLAYAHAALVSSAPAANSVLESGPPEIVLDFDESIEVDLTSIELFEAGGAAVELGKPAAGADDTIVGASVPRLGDGVFAVVWRLTSVDGHVIDGAFNFQVGSGASVGGQQLIDQVRDGRSAPSVRWWYGVARFLSLAGAIGLLGGGWWLLQREASPVSRRGPRRLLGVAWAAMLVGSLAAFGLFGAEAVAGSLGDALNTSAWGDLATTQTGRMLLLRVALVLVLGVLVALRNRRAQGWWRGASLTAAVLALYTFSASGHPNSLDPPAFWIAVDVVHLGSIAVWVGGLLVLAVGGSPGVAGPAGERLIRRFSRAVFICVPLIVATGVAQTLKLAGGLDDITATGWGRLLLIKVSVVTALLAVAGVSRWLLHHVGASSTRRTLIAEAVLGIVVVALAAGMVALPPEPALAARPFAEQLSANGLIVSLSLSPGSVGGNEMHVEITPPGGSITPISSATARVSLAAAGIASSPVTLVKEGPNHYSGSVTFPQSGDWTLELVVQVTASESVLLKTTVSIP